MSNTDEKQTLFFEESASSQSKLENFANLSARLDSITHTANLLDDLSNFTTATKNIKELKKATPSKIPGLNTADGIFDISSGIIQMAQATNAKRNKQSKALIGAATTFFGAQQLLIGEGLTTAVLTGVVTGTAAIGLSVTAGLSFAAGMWAATAKAYHDAHKAEQKMDMAYLTHDRLVKYQNLSKEINKLNDKISSETIPKKKIKLVQKRNSLLASQTILCNQAEAITKVEYSKQHSFANKYKVGDKSIINYLNDIVEQDVTKIKPSEQEQLLVNHLQEKQTNKFGDSLLSAAELSIGAVGLTLLAFAPICQPLAIPGLILTGASACAGLYHLTKNLLANKASEKIALKDEQKKIVNSFDNNLLEQERIPRFKNKKPLSTIDRIKLYYAYKNSGIENSQQFFKELNQRPRGKVNKEINSNFNQIAKDNILCREFNLPTNSDIDKVLSKKDQAKTFARHASKHHGLLKTAAHTAVGFFQSTKKEKAAETTLKPSSGFKR